jgi:hypothetical protein
MSTNQSKADAGGATADDENESTSHVVRDNNAEDNLESESPSHRMFDDFSKTSVVQYLGPSSSHCGYCKRSGSGRRSYGEFKLIYLLDASLLLEGDEH